MIAYYVVNTTVGMWHFGFTHMVAVFIDQLHIEMMQVARHFFGHNVVNCASDNLVFPFSYKIHEGVVASDKFTSCVFVEHWVRDGVNECVQKVDAYVYGFFSSFKF